MNSMRAILYTLLLPVVAWAQGYRLEPNQLIISESDWPGWNFPAGSVDFSAEGVRPHFVRRQINAALNAGAFSREDVTGGIRRAGTNFAGAAQLMDGREETYWEPALDAPLRDWWVEIDLGRVVWAEKVVVKFVAEGWAIRFCSSRCSPPMAMRPFRAVRASTIGWLVAARD